MFEEAQQIDRPWRHGLGPIRARKSSPAVRRCTFSSASAASVIGQVMASSVMLAALHAEQAELQRLDHAAQARVAGQHLHQALRLGQHF